MIKILLGGSPCTDWSIAKKDRETEPKGKGWELFKNYWIAKQKFCPDFFLYENVKSAKDVIKDEIKKRLNVWDGTLSRQDSGTRYIEINSALVSAQNRQRFYVHNCGEVGQPEDREILLRDILESGVVDRKKAYCLKHQQGNARDYFKKKHTQIKFEPVIFQTPRGKNKGGCKYKKAPTLTTARFEQNNRIVEPVRVGTYPSEAKNKESKQYRIYDINGKGTTLCGEGGGMGAKTGLYAVPYNYGAEAIEFDQIGKPTKAMSFADEKIYAVYEVKDGQITIKGNQYPIKLADGFYIIRKLTVTECCRLQTLPDDYCRAVSDTQAYRGLGNGWTAEVIIYILSHVLKDIPKDEKLLVLSMYDGIGTGRYCLDKMGFINIEYHAYEIDKYAMQIALSNYPDIIQHGDAFQVRNDDWNAPF